MLFKSVHLSGTGNTFHIVNDPKITPTADLARKMCEQFYADGAVFLTAQASGIYKWDFFNNDGSPAEMCGNATRCVGYFVKNILNDDSSLIKLQTHAGEIKIKPLKEDRFEVYMTPAQIFSHPKYFYCNTGVPHVVIEITAQDDFRQHKDMCREIRQSADFSPQGTNVTLVKRSTHADVRIASISFERGVEDFTEACGSGAVAAALYNSEKYKINKVTVEMPGGQVTVDVSDRQRPIMIGPAHYIKDCTYDIEI